MIEKSFSFTKTDSKHIERVLEDQRLGINHMVLPKGDALPIHNANSNVYMIVVRGTISLKLDEQEQNDYQTGNILVIPMGTLMNIFNSNDEIAEIFVVKSPSPSNM